MVRACRALAESKILKPADPHCANLRIHGLSSGATHRDSAASRRDYAPRRQAPAAGRETLHHIPVTRFWRQERRRAGLKLSVHHYSTHSLVSLFACLQLAIVAKPQPSFDVRIVRQERQRQPKSNTAQVMLPRRPPSPPFQLALTRCTSSRPTGVVVLTRPLVRSMESIPDCMH
jgi:hypothetical protein